jgi:ApbE superfamily uncharacterized protein (UPF0280 family)
VAEDGGPRSADASGTFWRTAAVADAAAPAINARRDIVLSSLERPRRFGIGSPEWWVV